MTVETFINQRRTDWQKLEQLLVDPATKRRYRSSAAAASEFSMLFRSACADLSRARTLVYPEDLIDYLNALTARAHNQFYLSAPYCPWNRIGVFFSRRLPLAVSNNAPYLVASLFLFYGPLLGMVLLAMVDDQALFQIVPQRVLESFEKMYQAGHRSGREETTDLLMTGFYVRNNVGIAFQCFASGIVFGLGSILLLIFNGTQIGAVVGFVSQTPSSLNLLSFIAGHGPFELTAICLAGAAGLRLGFGLVIAGHRTRIDSLRHASREAVTLILGAAAMLLSAALIEGFFSPSAAPIGVKFLFGGGCLAFLVWYLGFYSARCHHRSQMDLEWT